MDVLVWFSFQLGSWLGGRRVLRTCIPHGFNMCRELWSVLLHVFVHKDSIEGFNVPTLVP